MKQLCLIVACYIVSALSLICTILFRLVWICSAGRKISICIFGMALLVGTCLLFGRKRTGHLK